MAAFSPVVIPALTDGSADDKALYPVRVLRIYLEASDPQACRATEVVSQFQTGLHTGERHLFSFTVCDVLPLW